MRQGQQNRRGRGRNRKAHHNPLTRSYESNGPDVKIRGTPAHIAEKYMALARDALASGDPVLAENYLQHAEHYNRIIMAYREQTAQQAGEQMNGFNRHRNDILTDVDDFSDEDTEEEELLSPVEPDVQPRADVQLRTDEPRPRQLQDQIIPARMARMVVGSGSRSSGTARNIATMVLARNARLRLSNSPKPNSLLWSPWRNRLALKRRLGGAIVSAAPSSHSRSS